MKKQPQLSRRDFMKTAGSLGLGAVVASMDPPAYAAEKQNAADSSTSVPTRPFGKSGVNVSILSLGGMFDIPSNQLILKQAYKWGVTYWDTADCYGGGASEKGIGHYFDRYPEHRRNIFLVTKSDSRDPAGMTDLLNRSLDRMKTDYIDLYFIHGLRDIDELDHDIRKWTDKAKSQGKIKLFGFSTHKNMEACMQGAADLGWIDGIMMAYNYRLMHTDAMKAALAACRKSGIGLTAMKTQGGGSISTRTETELELAGRFLKLGFTDQQAKLKAVWENADIASICSQMPNLSILMSNIAAALNKNKLASQDRELLDRYALETRSGYCAGCADICEPEIGFCAPVSDIMRYLMYARNYGDLERAQQQFRNIPLEIRKNLNRIDYTAAERKCPNGIAIGRFMQEAFAELA